MAKEYSFSRLHLVRTNTSGVDSGGTDKKKETRGAYSSGYTEVKGVHVRGERRG